MPISKTTFAPFNRIVSCFLLGSALLLGLVDSVRAELWTRLYVFGDSYSDSGAGYVDGNGPTAVVYLARELNLPFTPANDPKGKLMGLNFAVSGATTGEGKGQK